jgi:hypothetical protein
MELRAREPLDDAEWALSRLDEVDDPKEFRVLWAAAISLLRAVGHVLYKVDAQDPKIRVEVDRAWSRWQSDREAGAIFWDFVDKERNGVLKEYGFGYEHGVFELVGLPVEGGEPVSLGQLPLYVFAPLAEGRYEGQDARDVALEAVEWWKTELAQIEAYFNERTTT